MSYALTLTGATYAAGKFGSARTAGNGTTASMSLGSAYTIEAFIKTTATGTEVAYTLQNASWNGVSGGKWKMQYFPTGGGSNIALDSTVSVNDGAFHHIALVVGPSGGKLFVDGVLQASSAVLPYGGGIAVEVGSFSGGYNFTGAIDELAFFTGERYTGNFTPPISAVSNTAPNILALYHFDGDSSDSAAPAVGATAVTLSLSASSGGTGSPVTVTVGTNAALTGAQSESVALTSNVAGTFSPTSVTLNNATAIATATYTPSATGSATITGTATGTPTLTNGTAAYTVTAPALYNRVDATDTFSGQNIMVLVPGGSSAKPYSSAVPTGVILYAHGMGEDQTGLVTDTLKTACVNALINAGYILAGTNAHGHTFGSQACTDDYQALAKYVRDNYNVKGIAIWSQSAGGCPGLNAVSQNKIKGLVGWLGTYPLVSLNAAYTGSAGGGNFSTNINSAYGITGTGNATYANLTNGHDPCTREAVAFRHLPMRFYASAGDTVVPKSVNTDVFQPIIAGSARESTVVVCSGDHGDPSHFVPSEYVAFFDRCFATMVATAGALGSVNAATTARTVTLTLNDRSGAPRANLSGLKWAFFDAVTPNLIGPPASQGNAATTNASGVLSLTVQTTLAASATGWLVLSDSAGNAATASNAFSGPVTVA